MKTNLFIISISILILSCKKEKNEFNENTSNEIIDNTILPNINYQPGTWWVYDWYKVDSLGNESPTNFHDSVYVVGDTLLNGSIYKHLSGNYFSYSGAQNWYIKDSSNHVVNSSGEILYGSVTNSDTTNVILSTYNMTHTIIHPGSYNTQVPAGTFNNLFSRQIHFYNTDSSNYTNCSFSFIQDFLYDPLIGEVYSECAYISELQTSCIYYKRVLVDYHIN